MSTAERFPPNYRPVKVADPSSRAAGMRVAVPQFAAPPLLVGVSTAVGGGVVGAILTQLLQAHGRRKELRAARDQKHREDVRAAHADFIGAYSKFLDASQNLWILKSGSDDMRAVGNLPSQR